MRGKERSSTSPADWGGISVTNYWKSIRDIGINNKNYRTFIVYDDFQVAMNFGYWDNSLYL